MNRFLVPSILSLATTLCIATWAPGAASAQESALPVSDDMQTLYRRALSRPGAVLLDAPDGTALRDLPPFEVFYIYDQNDNWTKVGTAVEGATAGYIATAQVLDWNTNIVATFNNRVAAERDRHLIFENREKVIELLGHEDVIATAGAYRDGAISGNPVAGSGVISIEPETHVDLRDRFYILPILEAERGLRLPGRNRGSLLKVAAMTANKEPALSDATVPDISQMPIDIVFVIDTTRSMQPYIDGVRQAARDFANEISGSVVSDRIRFGIVEFRDNIDLAPGLEYAAKIRLPLTDTSSAAAFVQAIDGVNATTVNTDGFNKDIKAGHHIAINELDWNDAGARMLYIISDAGPRDFNTTIPDIYLEQIDQTAEEKEIVISTWHLQTPAGSFDHASARSAFERISQFENISTYTAVDQGDPMAFRDVLENEVASFINMVAGAQDGLLADQIEAEEIDETVQRIGLALQLAYLGQTGTDTVPDVFDGWTIDRGIAQFQNPALEIRIMLTRNELSTLSQVVRTMITQMDAGMLDPTTFFEQMQGAMALLSQDSARVAMQDLEVLGDAVGAYLAELPYRSDIMGLDEAGWIALGGGGQQALKNRLNSKLRAYEDIFADPSLWTALDPSAPEGEQVSLIKLDLMP